MSKVKRYRGTLLDTPPHDAPDGDAEYVLASDCDALAARVHELEQELAECRAQLANRK